MVFYSESMSVLPGAKGILIDETGKVISSATTEYPLSTPYPLCRNKIRRTGGAGTVQSIQQALSSARITASR